MGLKIENKTVKGYDYEEQEATVVIPDGIEVIGEYAFSHRSKIKQVIIPPSVTRIEDCAFNDSGLESIEIPDSVTFLGQEAFRYCEYLKSVKIGEGIDRLNAYTFKNCHNLEHLEISAYLKSADYDCFVECYSLRSAWVNGIEYFLVPKHVPKAVKAIYESINASRCRYMDEAESGAFDEFEYTDYCIAGDGYSF